uniref:DUF1618 domain-containing protein n=1 Tax=Leersia perrieri TaxID=77586 RepID=A0A0D9VUM9_9ORYZ
MEQAKNFLSDYNYHLQQDQCIAVSGSRLRYVEVRAHRYCARKLRVAPPPLCNDCRAGSVMSWVMDDHSKGWVEEHTVKIADVWRNERYRSVGLPKEVPEFPLIDPFDPNILYFSIHEGKDDNNNEFCVNLGTNKVKSSSSKYKGLNSASGDTELVFRMNLKSTHDFDG